MLLILCLLLRSSWLTAEGNRQFGAAGFCIAGPDEQPWLRRSEWFVGAPLQNSPSRRVTHSAGSGRCSGGSFGITLGWLALRVFGG